VPRFDAELYLRLIGEQMLLDASRERGGWSSPLDDAAGALVAVGAITAAKAQQVLSDYSLAQSVRGGHGYPHMAMRMRRSPRARPRALKFKRVVPVDLVIDDPQGRLQLRYAVIGEEISLAFVYRPGPVPRSARRHGTMMTFGGGAGLPWGAPAPTLTDDRGNSATLSFSGGGSDMEWTGRLSAGDQLAADTRWLELDGRRIELDTAPVSAEVCVEELDEADPARRYLWHRLAVPERHGMPQEIDPAVEALIAAGALAPEDPAIAELEAVRERMPHHPHHRPGIGGIRTLPEPWRSLLRRVGRSDGPSGTLVLGAGTPLFDGHRVGVLSLESDASGFNAEVEVTPGMMHPFGGQAGEQLAWWARDDKGNHYLGSPGSWSGGGDYGGGEINFWPALDPRARRLELRLTAAGERAVIAFPLQWTSRPPDEQGVAT
jgi:hypothetical protein